MSDFLKNTIERIEQAGKIAGVSHEVLAVLKKPQMIVWASLCLKKDNGKIEIFDAYRVQHNDALGPFKGGIRFHPAVNLDEVSALAALMSLKNSAAGLPYGGAKGGIAVDPRELSAGELERLARLYCEKFHGNLGSQKDIPAPDVNTDSQIMAWMTDEYARIGGKFSLGVFTGKPIDFGGSRGRDVATSFGGIVVLEEFLAQHEKYKNKAKQEITVAIQGFGNVGANAALILFEKGYKVVAVSDSKGAIMKKDGLDVRKIQKLQQEKGLIEKDGVCKIQDIEYECEKISNEDLLELDVDVLIPAALEGQIGKENAPRIRAGIIVELANGPVFSDAEEILAKQGTEIIPDVIANAGGVAGSYFEWVQNNMGEQWDEKDVLEKIAKKMKEAFASALNEKNDHKIDFRMAAYVFAIKRIARALQLRGRV